MSSLFSLWPLQCQQGDLANGTKCALECRMTEPERAVLLLQMEVSSVIRLPCIKLLFLAFR